MSDLLSPTPNEEAAPSAEAPPPYVRLYVVPLTLAEANTLVVAWHRHHEEMQGHRFSVGVVTEDGIGHGAAIVGHAVARLGGAVRSVAEVARLVTDGTPNACSMLYAASARAAQAMGYERIQTYILDEEPGTSLRASGWEYEGVRGGGGWARPLQGAKRARSGTADHPTTPKGLWSKRLNGPRPTTLTMPVVDDDAPTLGLSA